MPFVRVNGVELHVQELGAGPALVLIHGLLVGSLATWYFGAAPALARRHRVLLYDLRGHGRSSRAPTGYDAATQAEDLRALTAELPGPFSLVGHSYGGLIALRFALAHPGRVRRLGLVDMPLPPSRLEEMEAFLSRTPTEMLEGLPEALRGAIAGPGRRARRFLAGLAFLVQETTLLGDLRAEPDIPDGVLATLRVPVSCFYGEHSSCRPVGERLARALPDAELRLLPGGHFLPVEARDALTGALVECFGG
jgi:pimeloyl-ACP methyl ester carboxylesterase